MAGISSKALAFGNPENKKKYNGIEKENDLQIEVYEAQFRELDGQTGVWWQVDPKTEKMEMWSPYASNYDNPFRYSDPLGDEGQACCETLKKIFASGNGYIVGMVDNVLGTNIRDGVKNSGIITDPETAKAYNAGLRSADASALVLGPTESAAGGSIVSGSAAVTAGTGGLSIEVTGPSMAAGGFMMAHGAFVFANGYSNFMSQRGQINVEASSSGNNPYGSKGKPDHQEKVKELEKKAQQEAKPGETVLKERKIQGQNSNRIPDVQIVDPTGRARKVLEAERKPTSTRNKKRESEYNRLGIDQETHKVGH